MAERRISSIQKTTRCKSARPRVAKNGTAHTTITKMKNKSPCQNFSRSFLNNLALFITLLKVQKMPLSAVCVKPFDLLLPYFIL
jgi:hypothetical protein